MKNFIRKAKTKAEHVELYQVTVKETPVQFENNRLKSIDTREKRVGALRLVKDGKLGFATSTGLDLDCLLEKALTTAQFGRKWEAPLPGDAPLPSVELFHPSTTAIETKTMVEMGQQIVDALRQCHKDALASSLISRSESTVNLVNSNGFAGKFSRSALTIFGGAELVEGKNLLSVFKGVRTGKLEKQQDETIQFLTENFKYGLTNAPITSDDYTVVFSPQGLGDILYPLMACANGKAVEKGFSPWKDKLGQALFSHQISLYDNPTVAYGPGSCLFDGEGIPAAPIAIIDKGVVSNFLLDLGTAHSLGLKPTGNGYRSQADALPAPGSSNVVLEAEHTQPLQTIIGGVKKGLLIHSLMGAWAGNPYTGQVSGNINLGFLVENGQIVGRVKDCMVSINAFDALKENIEAVSTEKEWGSNLWGSYMLLPYIQFGNVSVSAKG